MKVELTYFKQSGKYYSDGSYKTNYESLMDVWDEVRDMKKNGKLPGLEGGDIDFIIHINVPGAQTCHPKLIV